jgi:serine/threonine-protein kinase
MDAARWAEVAALFDELAELAPTERARRLAELAREDATLADEVASLLAADATDNAFLDGGAAAISGMLETGDDGAPADGMAGPYRLLRPLGEGGMGVVWLAERTDGAYEQQVAVKLLKRGMDTHAILRRFLQERRILARLRHPHVVRLLDGGMSADGRPFYVMDPVDGEPITVHASRHHLDVRTRVELLATVAEAVAYAHSQLVVHRDLKPSNVLVDATGEPRVLDFGIAKLIEESGEQTCTGTGMRVLSPAYAAPEQILGEPVGTATDVYALGLMLHELLVGELPQRRRATAVAAHTQGVADEPVERASSHAARLAAERVVALYGHTDSRRLSRQLAGDLDVILATALRGDPTRRYPTALAFANDLRCWLQGRTIAARPDSASYRVARFVRRHRVGVAATVLIALSLVGGSGVALWQAGQAREQASLAREQADRAERVKAFLVDILRENDPEIARGKDRSAAEILRRGRAELEASMLDDPQTRGELLVTIAEIQGNLGKPAEALVTAELALPLLVTGPQVDDALLAHAYAVRGALYEYLDRVQEAERDLRQSRAILARDAERHADQLAEVESQLAFVLRYTQSGAVAAALQGKVVEDLRARFGDEAPVVAEHRIQLALLLEDAGKFAQAEAEYRDALPTLVAAGGALSPRVCEAERNYAGLLDRLGRADEAEPRFNRALDCEAKLYGVDSILYARTRFSRGILYLNRHRHAEAESDFRAVVGTYADKGASAGHAHRYLGRALEEQGRLLAAIEEYATAERIYRETDLPNDLQRWRARADYGYALFLTGDVAKGRAAVDSALAGLESEAPAGDTFEFMRPLRALGEIARAQGELETAISAHRRWRELAVTIYGPESRDAYLAAHALAIDRAAAGTPPALTEAGQLLADAVSLARADDAPELAAIEQTSRDVERAIAGNDRATGTVTP